MSREAIHQALFNLVSSVTWTATDAQLATEFALSSRKLKHWSDVSPSTQPALFQSHKNEMVMRGGKGMPEKRTMSFDLYIYVNTSSTEYSPSAVMNPIIDAIDAALEPTGASDVQTLGGLVSHCWISGTIETDEGALGDQGVAIIPIEIITP